MANVPIPLEPPFTKNVSPGDSRLIIKTVDQTVHATSGKLAASSKETPDGTGRTCPAGTATFSAYPPPPTRAHTWSPTFHLWTFLPTASIVPEHSRPGYSLSPFGGGYFPWR
nr:Uncharacterised protein [Ipomoea batatas]